MIGRTHSEPRRVHKVGHDFGDAATKSDTRAGSGPLPATVCSWEPSDHSEPFASG